MSKDIKLKKWLNRHNDNVLAPLNINTQNPKEIEYLEKLYNYEPYYPNTNEEQAFSLFKDLIDTTTFNKYIVDNSPIVDKDMKLEFYKFLKNN